MNRQRIFSKVTPLCGEKGRRVTARAGRSRVILLPGAKRGEDILGSLEPLPWVRGWRRGGLLAENMKSLVWAPCFLYWTCLFPTVVQKKGKSLNWG